MDYFVGGVAALLSGNTTPSRPKVVKKPSTPTKQQPSPHVTPKSDLNNDRSALLSPSVQKKKAIIKKSPKRIFQNPDLDATDEGSDSNHATNSNKTEKVKKHLKEDLDSSFEDKCNKQSPKLNTIKTEKLPSNAKTENEGDDSESHKKIPKKKKRKSEGTPTEQIQISEEVPAKTMESCKNKSKKKKSNISTKTESNPEINKQIINKTGDANTKKIKKNKSKSQENIEMVVDEQIEKPNQSKKKKKNKKKIQKTADNKGETKVQNQLDTVDNKEGFEEKNINKNAITEKDTDSEHDSDNDIDSETENKNILDTGEASASSDDDEDQKPQEKSPSKAKPEKSVKPAAPVDAESEESVVRRTLFVGNVPFNKKCKKDIKRIFGKYGDIETVRIRTVPVKDGRVTPKMAVIKNELHPDRSTVNVYVKFKDESSVTKALVENNTVLNSNHLRVTRSDNTGCPDASLSIFVGNVPFSIEDDVLRAVFDRCGEVDSVRIVRDKQTNAGKGFGYVNFKSKDAVELALQMSEEDLTLKNRILRVKRCNYTKKGQQNTQTQRRDGNRHTSQKPTQNMNRNSSFRQGQKDWRGNKFEKDGRSNKFEKDGRGNKLDGDGKSGAYRRIQKRKNQENEKDGPPNKKPNNEINQPNKEKKQKKEFVGVTAEKKKKRKFDKGQKKKKVLSEILTK